MSRALSGHVCLALLATAAFSMPARATDELAVKFGMRPGVEQVSLSPDGTQVAFLGPAKGMGSSLMVAKVGDPNSAKIVLSASGDPERLQWCRWTSNTRLYCMIVAQTSDGVNENMYLSRIFAIDSDGTKGKLLSARNSARTVGYNLYGGSIIDRLPEDPGNVLMVQNKAARDTTGSLVGTITREQGLLVARVDTLTARATEVEKPREENREFITDGHGNVRIRGIAFRKGDYLESGKLIYQYRRPGSDEWLKLSEYDTESYQGFNPLAVDPKLNVAYGFDKRQGRIALYKIALDGSGEQDLVFAHPQVDVDGLVRIGLHQRVVGVSYATEFRTAEYFDPEIGKLRQSLEKALPGKGNIGILDSSVDETKLLVHASSDLHPGTWYVLNRTSKQMSPVLAARPQLEGVALGEMKPIAYKAADGTMIPAYLTLPPGGAQKNLPAIVLPHGGPSSRDEWGFDWLTQYFVAKGYAVIQPQFRGSAGYGDQWFRDNGFKQWKVAIGDVTDAGRYLVSQGIADPAKLSIVGWSYGGYAALQSAVADPGLFKSVVAIAPVTDLDRLREQYRNWSNFFLASAFIGDQQVAQEASPARHADRIKAPVLIFHGGRDFNVDIAHATLMDSRLKAAGVPHRLVTWDKLDHYLEDSDARIQMLTEIGAFLADPQSVAGK